MRAGWRAEAPSGAWRVRELRATGLLRVVNTSKGTVVGDRVRVAASPAARVRGLLGTGALEPGAGLVLVPCRWVHTFGMAFPIDLVYLERDGRVDLVRDAVPPGRLAPRVGRAACVLELPAGAAAAARVEAGDRLCWRSGEGPAGPAHAGRAPSLAEHEGQVGQG